MQSVLKLQRILVVGSPLTALSRRPRQDLEAQVPQPPSIKRPRRGDPPSTPPRPSWRTSGSLSTVYITLRCERHDINHSLAIY